MIEKLRVAVRDKENPDRLSGHPVFDVIPSRSGIIHVSILWTLADRRQISAGRSYIILVAGSKVRTHFVPARKWVRDFMTHPASSMEWCAGATGAAHEQILRTRWFRKDREKEKKDVWI